MLQSVAPLTSRIKSEIIPYSLNSALYSEREMDAPHSIPCTVSDDASWWFISVSLNFLLCVWPHVVCCISWSKRLWADSNYKWSVNIMQACRGSYRHRLWFAFRCGKVSKVLLVYHRSFHFQWEPCYAYLCVRQTVASCRLVWNPGLMKNSDGAASPVAWLNIPLQVWEGACEVEQWGLNKSFSLSLRCLVI